MKKGLLLVFALLLTAFMLNAVPRDYVVVEVVTGTWCQYCPGAALGVDDMINQGLRAAVIEYHGGDVYENTASSTRINYYGVSNYPTAFFDGQNGVVGGDHTESMYSYYLPKYNNRIGVNSAYTITLTGQQTSDFINVTATVTQVEASTASNLKLQAALTESGIVVAWQGQDHLDFVERAMYPSATGTTVNLTQGNSQTVNYSIPLNSAWTFNNLELVVFLQNNSTKEIYQGTKIKLAGLVNAFPISAPSLDMGDIVVNNSESTLLYVNNYWNQTMTGTIASDNPLIQINYPGRMDFTIPPSGQEIYRITCFPNVVGTFTGNINITTNIPAYPTITIPVTANSFYDNQPTVTDVHVEGIPVAYETLTGAYTFHDVDGDAEGTSTYQWYRMVSGTYIYPIDGQTGISYTVQPENVGEQIIFGIGPTDEHGITNATVMSTPSDVIIARPAPQNVTAQVSNNSNVILNWQTPMYYGRGLFGYKIYRNGTVIATISNTATLTYTDSNLPNGTYEYHMTAIYNNPLSYSASSNNVTVEVTQSTDNHDQMSPALTTKLMPAYPNPFRANSTLHYTLAEKGNVDISIYDIRGRVVKTLFQGVKDSGEYNVNWDGSDENGIPAANGVYLCRMQASGKTSTVRMVLVK